MKLAEWVHIIKGDKPGHAFHGNQFTSARGGRRSSKMRQHRQQAFVHAGAKSRSTGSAMVAHARAEHAHKVAADAHARKLPTANRLSRNAWNYTNQANKASRGRRANA